MVIALTLLALGGLTAALAPRALARGDWTDREPVLALWVWQCVVAAVLLCCALAMALLGAAASDAVRGPLFGRAPDGVLDAYALPAQGHLWAALLAAALAGGGTWTAAMLVREIRAARAVRRARRRRALARAPRMPGEGSGSAGPLTVVEDERPDAWPLPGPPPRLAVTSAALRRLRGHQLDAVLAHERSHRRARHDWLLHCSGALARGFPRVPVFDAFRHQVHRLVEMAADDVASRRFGRLTTALALVGLNEDRGVFGPRPPHQAQLPHRVDRLLSPGRRFSPLRRLRLTAAAALLPAIPLVVTLVPGLFALR